MFGINGYEFILLAIIAVIVLGPERLPEYASQLAQLVKGLRRMATGAREQLREEVGSEFDDVLSGNGGRNELTGGIGVVGLRHARLLVYAHE